MNSTLRWMEIVLVLKCWYRHQFLKLCPPSHCMRIFIGIFILLLSNRASSYVLCAQNLNFSSFKFEGVIPWWYLSSSCVKNKLSWPSTIQVTIRVTIHFGFVQWGTNFKHISTILTIWLCSNCLCSFLLSVMYITVLYIVLTYSTTAFIKGKLV